MKLCEICNEDEATEEHEGQGMICKDCSDSIANIETDDDEDAELSNYEKRLQNQIDNEPNIDCED